MIKTDVLIIGAGAVGVALARELSKYKIKTIVCDTLSREETFTSPATADVTAIVEGVEFLKAAPTQAYDLRAGAAMVIAALAAHGESEISGIHYIERGYENIVEKLRGIGADIREVETPDDTAAEANIG